MPKQVSNSGFMAKYGAKLKKAHTIHKDDETEFGAGGSLPAGIEGGVAQLTSIKFGQYKEGTQNAGEWYFRAAGTVLLPKEHRGSQTSIMEPMHDTPERTRKTFDDHLGWVYNELRKLGVETKELDPADLESVFTALKESAPTFKFRTWQGEPTKEYPNPRVNEQWRGTCDYEADESGDVVDESSEGETEAPAEDDAGDEWDTLATQADADDNAAVKKLFAAATAAGYSKDEIEGTDNWGEVADMIRSPKKAKKGAKASEPEPEETEDAVDWNATGEAGDTGDSDAIDALNEAAAEHGLDPNEYPTWAELGTAIAEAIASGEEGGEEEAEAEAEEFVPKKGDTYLYKPAGNDPRTKKPYKKPIECECVAVFEKNKTMNLRNSDDGKTVYKSVAWDAIAGD